jgi:hypothetical protein
MATFLVVPHLMGTRLTNVDDGLTALMRPVDFAVTGGHGMDSVVEVI